MGPLVLAWLILCYVRLGKAAWIKMIIVGFSIWLYQFYISNPSLYTVYGISR